MNEPVSAIDWMENLDKRLEIAYSRIAELEAQLSAQREEHSFECSRNSELRAALAAQQGRPSTPAGPRKNKARCN